jgi:hypothetical protein
LKRTPNISNNINREIKAGMTSTTSTIQRCTMFWTANKGCHPKRRALTTRCMEHNSNVLCVNPEIPHLKHACICMHACWPAVRTRLLHCTQSRFMHDLVNVNVRHYRRQPPLCMHGSPAETTRHGHH